MERWVPYKYDNNYLISDHGRVKSLKSKLKYQKPIEGRILKEADYYCLNYRVWKTSRLVAEHFLEITGTHVIQLESNSNHYSNLKWVNSTECMKHNNKKAPF